MKKRIAVIGGGVAGITAAYYLQNEYEISIFEKNDYLGGHTNTISLKDGEDAGAVVDTGFIVLNDKNYPNLHKMLKDLGVATRYSNMSFSFYSEKDNFCYSGDTLLSLFADRQNLLRPGFYKFILEISKFSAQAIKDLNAGISAEISLQQYLKKYNYSESLVSRYLLPMGSAIWSTGAQRMLEFPASALLNFFKNHGLLSLKDRPKWQTVVGGSQSYVKKFQQCFNGNILLKSAVTSIRKEGSKYRIKTNQSEQDFDIIISALHANLVNKVIEVLSESSKELFDCWDYNLNRTVLHSDCRAMPKNKRVWASWNYIEGNQNTDQKLYTSYYMNLLMGLKCKHNYFVSLNCPFDIDPEKIIYQVDYEHPLYTTSSLSTQKKIADLNGQSDIWFCGSYLGNGFHEDAVSSALNVVRGLQLK